LLYFLCWHSRQIQDLLNFGVGRNTSKDDASIHVCGGTKREDGDGDGDSSKCNFVSADT